MNMPFPVAQVPYYDVVPNWAVLRVSCHSASDYLFAMTLQDPKSNDDIGNQPFLPSRSVGVLPKASLLFSCRPRTAICFPTLLPPDFYLYCNFLQGLHRVLSPHQQFELSFPTTLFPFPFSLFPF
jgi:hypothetical protein